MGSASLNQASPWPQSVPNDSQVLSSHHAATKQPRTEVHRRLHRRLHRRERSSCRRRPAVGWLAGGLCLAAAPTRGLRGEGPGERVGKPRGPVFKIHDLSELEDRAGEAGPPPSSRSSFRPQNLAPRDRLWETTNALFLSLTSEGFWELKGLGLEVALADFP